MTFTIETLPSYAPYEKSFHAPKIFLSLWLTRDFFEKLTLTKNIILISAHCINEAILDAFYAVRHIMNASYGGYIGNQSLCIVEYMINVGQANISVMMCVMLSLDRYMAVVRGQPIPLNMTQYFLIGIIVETSILMFNIIAFPGWRSWIALSWALLFCEPAWFSADTVAFVDFGMIGSALVVTTLYA